MLAALGLYYRLCIIASVLDNTNLIRRRNKSVNKGPML